MAPPVFFWGNRRAPLFLAAFSSHTSGHRAPRRTSSLDPSEGTGSEVTPERVDGPGAVCFAANRLQWCHLDLCHEAAHPAKRLAPDMPTGIRRPVYLSANPHPEAPRPASARGRTCLALPVLRTGVRRIGRYGGAPYMVKLPHLSPNYELDGALDPFCVRKTELFARSWRRRKAFRRPPLLVKSRVPTVPVMKTLPSPRRRARRRSGPLPLRPVRVRTNLFCGRAIVYGSASRRIFKTTAAPLPRRPRLLSEGGNAFNRPENGKQIFSPPISPPGSAKRYRALARVGLRFAAVSVSGSRHRRCCATRMEFAKPESRRRPAPAADLLLNLRTIPPGIENRVAASIQRPPGATEGSRALPCLRVAPRCHGRRPGRGAFRGSARCESRLRVRRHLLRGGLLLDAP